MSLKHCKSHQLPIQKLVLVRLDTMLDLLANSPASVAAFTMRVWGCGGVDVGVWGVRDVGGVGACRAKPCLGLIPFPISHCFQPTHRLSTAAATAAAGISRMAVQPLSPRIIANMACAQWPPGEQRKSGWPPGTGALPHTLGPASATGPGPDQGRVCQEVLSCHWPAPQSGQPDSGWAAAAAESCHHWRRGQLWHWPMTMRKQQHGTLLGVTWPFTKSLGPRRRRGRDLVGLVLDRGWWYCWGIHWTVAT